MKSNLIYLIITCLFLGCMQLGIAQSGVTSAKVTANLVLAEVYNIEIEEGEDIQFAFQNKEDYDNGIELKQASSLVLAANASWQVSMDTNGSEFFTASNAENNGTMPVSVLRVKASTSEEYLPLSANTTVIYTSNTRGSNQELTLDYLAKPEWNTPKDSYVLEIRYTIAPN